MNFLVSLMDTLDPLSPELVNKKQQVKTPHSFLGENSALVNLDNLIKPNNLTNNNAYNPFSDSSAQQPKNLFQQNQPPVSDFKCCIKIYLYLLMNICLFFRFHQSIN